MGKITTLPKPSQAYSPCRGCFLGPGLLGEQSLFCWNIRGEEHGTLKEDVEAFQQLLKMFIL